MRWQASIVLLSLIASLVLVRPSVAEAAGPEELFRTGNEVTIAAEETVPHDLFIAAQTIRIDGVVKGDVGAVGRRVVINGTIEGDLWGAAESVEINGQLLGDLRVCQTRFRSLVM